MNTGKYEAVHNDGTFPIPKEGFGSDITNKIYLDDDNKELIEKTSQEQIHQGYLQNKIIRDVNGRPPFFGDPMEPDKPKLGEHLLARHDDIESANAEILRTKLPQDRKLPQGRNEKDTTNVVKDGQSVQTQKNTITSKYEMMKFAIPTLGIFLTAPLLSNIDNAFIGKTVGTDGLAALSPAALCIDQMLSLFSFLSRATTGIVSRAYSSKKNEEDRIASARKAASTPIVFAIFSGVLLSIFYAIFTPQMVLLFGIDEEIRAVSASYVYWRGSIAWAAVIQMVCLSIMLATRDAITPLKIVALAALVDVIGDTLLCVYPLQWGCAGAAAATAFATIFSSGCMLMNLHTKKLLPKLSIPTLSNLNELFGQLGPLFVMMVARLAGFVSLTGRAATFDTEPLAAFQICANVMAFYYLFGEPFSQLHQTKLPEFLDANDKQSTISTMKAVMTLAAYTGIIFAALTYATLTVGVGIFTSDADVQALVRNAAPAVSLTVIQVILTVALDGAMLASQDFSYIALLSVLTCPLQIILASRCYSLNTLFLSLWLRQGLYAVSFIIRIAAGYGSLGRVLGIWKRENHGCRNSKMQGIIS